MALPTYMVYRRSGKTWKRLGGITGRTPSNRLKLLQALRAFGGGKYKLVRKLNPAKRFPYTVPGVLAAVRFGERLRKRGYKVKIKARR